MNADVLLVDERCGTPDDATPQNTKTGCSKIV
jgi:hypothetical protein